MKKEISQIEYSGYDHNQNGRAYLDCHDGEITPFEVNGEMAPVIWYRQKNVEINGKYVIRIDYK